MGENAAQYIAANHDSKASWIRDEHDQDVQECVFHKRSVYVHLWYTQIYERE